jgi:tryptophan-rich sensory protein
MTRRLFCLFVWSVIPFVLTAFQVSSRGGITRGAPSPIVHSNGFLQTRTTSASSFSQLASTASKKQENEALPVDYDALLKYHLAVAIQMTLFTVLLTGLDTLVDATDISVPFPAVAALFYGFSLKSRIFNPLNNARPNVPKPDGDSSSPGFRDRAMPSWTPPGVVFPIMWILIIGPLRAYSSALVVETTGHFCDPAVLAFLFHLSVGDVWNTINNTEKRYGASVTGVLCVLASLLNAASQYYNVDPLAGNLLGLTVIWLSVATSLITATWQLNPNPVTGEKDPLYPVKGEAMTEFEWFQKQ